MYALLPLPMIITINAVIGRHSMPHSAVNLVQFHSIIYHYVDNIINKIIEWETRTRRASIKLGKMEIQINDGCESA